MQFYRLQIIAESCRVTILFCNLWRIELRLPVANVFNGSYRKKIKLAYQVEQLLNEKSGVTCPRDYRFDVAFLNTTKSAKGEQTRKHVEILEARAKKNSCLSTIG
ncbi:hypothetical protein PoB_006400500 [Plakobranchus ocellatus]|uniref:Uncharacterized protein n=1 Tax=Plakobranchus ocellatus TaxID=259542 RepID=A0AAV4D0C9_9GAST|nr:hypothetical protein PoB_006400500 [Plakobranchus ocellatus]